MKVRQFFSASNDFVKLFDKKNYEIIVLRLMNESKTVFNGTYSMVPEQSNGECDFVDNSSGEKYDAKLPFLPNQIEMLTDGKRHKPELEKWITDLMKEQAEYNPIAIRNDPSYDIGNTKLYSIMKAQIERDKIDENVIFFLPYPITLCVRDSIFLQFASDYLNAIYDRLKQEINIQNRRIYAIYPSSEKNTFVLRNIGSYSKEYIQYDDAERYFYYEVVNVSMSE